MLAGDEAAFEAFSNNYIPVLHRFAHRRLGSDRELVRDVVQSTLCKVIAKLGTYRGEALLLTWLCACCKNEIAGHFRKKGRSREDHELDDDVAAEQSLTPALTDSPERVLLSNERRALVHEALDSLPPHYGRALEWKYLDELSVKEIASRLDLTPKATESLLTRARRSLRERLYSLGPSNAAVARTA